MARKLKHVLVFAELALLAAGSNATALAEDSISVEKAVFCRTVDHLNPVGIFSASAVIHKEEPLYIWIRVRGNDEAIRMLKSWKRLPIYYSWVKGAQTGLVDIGIKPQRFSQTILKALEWQVADHGYFTWRTYGYSQHLSDGNWSVSLLDANKKIIREIPPPVNRVFKPTIAVITQRPN